MKKNRFFIFLFYTIIFLSIDFISTNLIIKKTQVWKNINNNYFFKKHWRIESSKYHHDLKKNINVTETWGEAKYKLITNSLGFRDFETRNIKNKNFNKKRIYINGDSFIEGVGYNYENTSIGLLQNYTANNYEILNSAVTSYSPSIYYTKTLHYINSGIEFDYALVFLDISDIPDESFISEDLEGNIFDIRQQNNKTSTKGKVYLISRFYRDYFTSGKILAVIRERVGSKKSEIKKKFLASKFYDKSFFKVSDVEINLYKSLHRDRSMWTYSKKYSDKWEKKGLEKSDKYLSKLFKIFEKKKVKSYLIIYPNPGQIFYSTKDNHIKYWENWSLKNDVNLINLYKYFNDTPKNEAIKNLFIPGDVHWNKEGHLLIFEALKKELASIL